MSVQQITDFTRYHVVRSLDVSPNDKHLAAVVDNQLMILPTDGKTETKNKAFDEGAYLRDVRWLTDDYIVVSHQTKNEAWLTIYDRELNAIHKLPPQWQQLFADQQDATAWYALHQQHGLVKVESVVFEQDTALSVVNTLISPVQSQGKIIKDGSHFYQQVNRTQITQFDSKGELRNTHKFRRVYGFDANRSNLITSDLKYQTSDWHAKRLSD